MVDQEQKRQLNARVAEALGYEIISGEVDNVNPLYNNGHRLKDMDFSGTWEWMGVMIENARGDGILIDIETMPDRYRARAFLWIEGEPMVEVANSAEGQSGPHVACDVFLQAKGTVV